MRDPSNGPCPSCASLIDHLPPEVRARARHERHAAGELICRKGEALRKVLLLCQGRAVAVCDAPQGATELGLPAWQPGAVLGDQELFEGALRWRVSVRAQTPCQVLVLDPEVFLASLKHFEAAASLLHHTLQRNRQTQRALIDHTLHPDPLVNRSAG